MLGLFKKNQKSIKNNKGFTLVELIIVLAIFLIVGLITLFNYDSFRSNITVNNVAQEIALTVRKAQSYALGLQAPGVLASLPVKGYGVRFESGFNNQITFFAEIAPSDNQFTNTSGCGVPAQNNECIEHYLIDTGDTIESLIIDGVDVKLDDPSSSVDVLFKKPTGDVVFCVHFKGSNCSSSSVTSVSYFDIVLVSESGVRKIVHVYNNGQISVE